MEIKRFLGFTDNISEPRKTKIENDLNKLYRRDGKIYNSVNFLCDLLLEGYTPGKMENYQYYKRDGRLSKPKTIYKYNDPKSNAFFELTKTQYDFVCYLLENGLNTEESMLAYDKADIEFIELQKIIKKKKMERQNAEERRRTEEKERMKKFIAEQAQNTSQQEKEIVEKIFLSIYGKECGNYTLIAEIHNFDNPYCKEEIISRLHNDNKASIKIFECITGLKLPKSYKERKTYLEGLTSADFKGMTEYKPRKKREGKEIQKEEFYISENISNGANGAKWTKVLAEPLTKYGVKMFIRCDNGRYTISLAESGLLVVFGNTKKECINKLEAFVDRRTQEGFIRMVKKATEEIYKKIGKNPRYADM